MGDARKNKRRRFALQDDARPQCLRGKLELLPAGELALGEREKASAPFFSVKSISSGKASTRELPCLKNTMSSLIKPHPARSSASVNVDLPEPLPPGKSSARPFLQSPAACKLKSPRRFMVSIKGSVNMGRERSQKLFCCSRT